MKKVLLFVLVSVLSIGLYSQEDEGQLSIDDMMAMSLEDLMNLEVNIGTISGTSKSKLPASVTTITKEDIELSNAQNILHLIQMYVPGANYFRHNEGANISIRGITSDRNTKLLLTVNGLLVNQKSHRGVATELENWDMNDIERVEVIRGPGSVTYGPGAIAGVINIVTKTGKDNQGLNVSVGHASGYNNKTVSVSYGFERDKVNGFVHVSEAWTKGVVPDGKYMHANPWGTTGDYLIGSRGDTTGLNDRYGNPALDYMGDYKNQSQLKFLASFNMFDELTFTARYNRAGATYGGYATSKSQPIVGYDNSDNPIYGSPINTAYHNNQQLIVSLKNNHEFSGTNFELNSELAFVGSDYLSTNGYTQNFARSHYDSLSLHHDMNDLEYALNARSNFSENAIVGKTTGLYKFSDKYKVAAGAEVINTRYGKGWGDDPRQFRLGEAQEILSGADSYSVLPYNGAYRTKDTSTMKEGEDYFFVGNGWHTWDIGLVAEANLEFNSYFNLLLSARADKNTYSDWLFSPRVAVVSEINDKNIVKLIVQQSNKINSAEQLYRSNQLGEEGETESVTNTEIIYTSILGDNAMLNVAGYYNFQDAIGWNWGTFTAEKVAKVQIAGFDIDYNLTYDKFRIGANHAFSKQVKFKLEDDVFSSAISGAEYYKVDNASGDTINVGNGNDLRNISNNITKVYLDQYFLDKKLVFHTEFTTIWGYQGNKDMQPIAEATAYTPEDATAVYNLYDDAINNEGFYGNSYFWNASVTANLVENIYLTLGVTNILGKYGKVSDFAGINESSYISEPRSFTAKLVCKL